MNAAKAFNDALELTGVIITKLDGDTRGGAALSVREVTGKPIKFCGNGEKLTDIEPFYPDRMASRILGMGDVMTLIEKAQESFDAKKAEELAKKISCSRWSRCRTWIWEACYPWFRAWTRASWATYR